MYNKFRTSSLTFKPISHCYVEELGFTGVYTRTISLSFALKKNKVWEFVRTALMRRLKRVPKYYVLNKKEKTIILSENYH